MNVYKIIFEGRGSSTLYHGTTLDGAYGILSKNLLKGRNISFARTLTSTFYGTEGFEFIFEINKNKLDLYKSKDFYIFPYVDDKFYGEQEERILMKGKRSLDNINDFIDKLIININFSEFGSKSDKMFSIKDNNFLKTISLARANNIEIEIRNNLTKLDMKISDLLEFFAMVRSIYGEKPFFSSVYSVFFYCLENDLGFYKSTLGQINEILEKRNESEILIEAIENAISMNREAFEKQEIAKDFIKYPPTSFFDDLVAINYYIGGRFTHILKKFKYKPKHSIDFYTETSIKLL